jgi:hypothetical protein
MYAFLRVAGAVSVLQNAQHLSAHLFYWKGEVEKAYDNLAQHCQCSAGFDSNSVLCHYSCIGMIRGMRVTLVPA